MKIHQKPHVSDETSGCFRRFSLPKIAMVGCQTAKVPREAVEAEVVESFQNEKLDYARKTQQVDPNLAGRVSDEVWKKGITYVCVFAFHSRGHS